MNKTACSLLLAGALMLAGMSSKAQNKIGYISFNDLLASMPELRKADTTLAEYRAALEQRFQEYKNEYTQKLQEVTGPDTAKFANLFWN